MLVKLTDDWFVDASLISAVVYHPAKTEKRIAVSFFSNALAEVEGTRGDVARIVAETNTAKAGVTREEDAQK